MKQQRFKLHLLHVVKRIENYGQELQEGRQKWQWNIASVWPVWTHAERMTGRFLKASQYQIHDEIELYGEVNDEEHTGPAVLGVCWHHHIRETTKKELTWDKKMTHDALKAELPECKPINIKDVTSHTVQFCLLKSIFSKINPIFQRVLEWTNRNWKLGAASSIAKLT